MDWYTTEHAHADAERTRTTQTEYVHMDGRPYPMRMRSESDPNPIKNREHRNKEGVYPLTRCVSDPNPIIRPVFFYRIGERIFWKIGRKNGLGLGLGPETGVIPWRITEWRNIDLE